MRSYLEKEDFPCQVLRCVWRYLVFAYRAEQGLVFSLGLEEEEAGWLLEHLRIPLR